MHEADTKIWMRLLVMVVVGAAALGGLSWMNSACDRPTEKLEIVTKSVGACAEFWFFRYQTLLGVLVALGAAYIAVRSATEQTRVSRQQLAASALESLNQRAHQLQELRTRLIEAAEVVARGKDDVAALVENFRTYRDQKKETDLVFWRFCESKRSSITNSYAIAENHISLVDQRSRNIIMRRWVFVEVVYYVKSAQVGFKRGRQVLSLAFSRHLTEIDWSQSDYANMVERMIKLAVDDAEERGISALSAVELDLINLKVVIGRTLDQLEGRVKPGDSPHIPEG